MVQINLEERRNELIKFLQEGRVLIKFKKVSDGTERIMRCTLNQDIIVEQHGKLPDDTKSKRTVNNKIISVFDLDRLDWRSFRVDTLIESKLE